jgi:hypothetical protein
MRRVGCAKALHHEAIFRSAAAPFDVGITHLYSCLKPGSLCAWPDHGTADPLGDHRHLGRRDRERALLAEDLSITQPLRSKASQSARGAFLAFDLVLRSKRLPRRMGAARLARRGMVSASPDARTS